MQIGDLIVPSMINGIIIALYVMVFIPLLRFALAKYPIPGFVELLAMV